MRKLRFEVWVLIWWVGSFVLLLAVKGTAPDEPAAGTVERRGPEVWISWTNLPPRWRLELAPDAVGFLPYLEKQGTTAVAAVQFQIKDPTEARFWRLVALP